MIVTPTTGVSVTAPDPTLDDDLAAIEDLLAGVEGDLAASQGTTP